MKKKYPHDVVSSSGNIGSAAENPMLSVEDLKVYFPVETGFLSRRREYVYAVDGVSFDLKKGETLGIVGESGCGKTTTGMAVLNLEQPTSGRVVFKGQDITDFRKLSTETQLQLRKEMQVIFQDPYSSLNPRTSLDKILEEPMKVHGLYPSPGERRDRVAYLLERVGLTPSQGKRYPHSFSGGQRQRIGIARSLALNPSMIVGDEPVSALDVSIQAQIINLLIDLQSEFDLSYVLIAHDLAVVEHISDRIAVMYLGRIVETAPYDRLFVNPLHPYTQALMSAIPVPDPKARKNRIVLTGDVPSPRHPPSGCAFHPRCPERLAECSESAPGLLHKGQAHHVACHLVR
ncbi:MAG: dipeptide ABC transporter ATP-binding protein [Desulfobacteraceae bacterium]|nr:dipeptide ABC transporter ATP-binding protein [Desulfobacteraceae bacterium]